MLALVESRNAKIDAQRRLTACLERAWGSRETRVVVWRPASIQMPITHNGRYWFGSLDPNQDESTPKYWNPFGRYHQSGNLQIAVEINIPTGSNSRRIAGFFAKDIETDVVYLMHDGGVGGGRQGVGRDPFLAWSSAKPEPVVDSHRALRLGIVVAPVDSRTTAGDIARFIRLVVDFKQAVSDDETVSDHARAAQRTFKDYYDEFAGRKRRRRVREVEYISRHGDIVRALCNWRQHTAKAHERIVKNAYIDLGIEIRGVLTELYEVKTNCDRQTLYSAIGQVVVHGEFQSGTSQRFLVLPSGEQISDDIDRALTRAGISVIRFELDDDEIRIVE
jgi:hypothetical protein